MYMPLSQTPEQREHIRQSFVNYCQLLQPLMKKYNAQLHWAKIELPVGKDGENTKRLEQMRLQIRQKYPTDEFKQVRKAVDPEGILSNSIVDQLLD